jgi:hypothetical protein
MSFVCEWQRGSLFTSLFSSTIQECSNAAGNSLRTDSRETIADSPAKASERGGVVDDGG